MPLDPDTLGDLHGAELRIQFESLTALAQSIGCLLGCHQHNFAVVTGGAYPYITVSRRARDCLEQHWQEGRIHSS